MTLPVDASPHFLAPKLADASHSTMARGMEGSSILRIAAEVRAMQAAGKEVCNLTVGDFDSRQFPVPAQLIAETEAALRAGHTNYPPADGVIELRQAVRRYYERELGLKYPVESIAVASGARPILYAAYGVTMDPGDEVVFPVPSWNNLYYAQLWGAKVTAIPVGRETGFHLTANLLRPHLATARLVVVNSPQNPTGTVISPEQLRELTQMIVSENQRRAAAGEKLLFLLYDQVYWTLTFGGVKHVSPIELVPESAPYVIMLDAVSKAFAATGMRVGWTVAPPPVTLRMRDLIGHIGAWAPRAEQIATAKWLDAVEERQAWEVSFRGALRARLDALYRGCCALSSEGLPVEAIEPQGAIYLSVRFGLRGANFPNNDAIRRHLLEHAGTAVVPFEAFGAAAQGGWCRLSVGAVSLTDIERMLPRLRAALLAG